MRLSVVCSPATDAKAAAAIAAAKDAGLTALEEVVPNLLGANVDEAQFRERLAAIQAHGLPLVSACCLWAPGTVLTGPKADHSGLEAWSATVMRRAELAGMRTIVAGGGWARRRPELWERERALDQFAAAVRIVCRAAADHGITVAVEPLQASECNLVNDLDDGAAVVARVGHTAARLTADIYHLDKHGAGPDQLRRHAPLIAHAHIAEAPDRTPPGTTGRDFRPWFQALRDIGYRGDLSIECGWQDMPAQLPAAVAALRAQLAPPARAAASAA